jgi:hypothetical protein
MPSTGGHPATHMFSAVSRCWWVRLCVAAPMIAAAMCRNDVQGVVGSSVLLGKYVFGRKRY